MPNSATTCWIYKSLRRQETYLFLPDEDDTGRVPADLLRRLGELEFVMTLELTAGRTLARAEASEVLDALAQRGFYLQLPPVDAAESQRPQ